MTDRSPAEAAQVSFVAGLAVVDLVSHYVPEAIVRIKWPNDVLVAGEKVSGILVESGPYPTGRMLWMAVGIGVNLSLAPSGLERPATCLADHLRPEQTRPPTPSEALKRLSMSFAVTNDLWEHEGFQSVARAWSLRANLGGRVTARLATETIEGVADGLEPDGGLRLRLDDGSFRRITAGDVFPLAGAA